MSDTEVKQPEEKPRLGIHWLASYPKSGNTWARMFIEAYVTGYPPDINAACKYATSDLLEIKHRIGYCGRLENLDSDGLLFLRNGMLMNMLADNPGRDICLKTHHVNTTYRGHNLIPEQLTKNVAYFVRDPRDIVISWAKHLGVTIDECIDKMRNPAQCIARECGLFHFLSTWSGHVQSWIGCGLDNVSVIRYESMLDKPAAAFELLLKAVGFPEPDTARMSKAYIDTRLEEMQKQEATELFRERGNKQNTFFNVGTAGHWQDVLTPKQSAAIEEHHGEVMRELGYL